MSSVERSTSIAASPDVVWTVLADFAALATWVPMIQHSCALSEQTEGIGTIRRVQLAQQTLVERVTEWNPATTLAYDIEGLPPMIGSARNTWRLSPDDIGCRVVLTTEIQAGKNPAKRLIAKKVLERMSLASEVMLAGLNTAATDGDTVNPAQRTT